MAHQIETMAYTNEVPWHGLGFNVEKSASVDRMLKAAQLDWEVNKRPLYTDSVTMEAGKKSKDQVLLPSNFALVRNTDNQILDVVGKQYTPIQNHEAFEFFKEFVEAGDATMETAGSLRNGQIVWGLANLNSTFKMKGDDEVKGYVLVMAPHVAGKSFLIKFTTVRVVCNNTLSLALKNSKGARPEFRMSHRKEFDKNMVETAKTTLGIARDQMNQFEETAKKLQKIKLSEEDVIKVLAPIYQKDEKVQFLIEKPETRNPRLDTLLDVYKNAPGAQPGNGWGLLNAVTYYADHVASRTQDKRLTNAWIGKTAKQKEKVLEALMAA